MNDTEFWAAQAEQTAATRARAEQYAANQSANKEADDTNTRRAVAGVSLIAVVGITGCAGIQAQVGDADMFWQMQAQQNMVFVGVCCLAIAAVWCARCFYN